MVENQNTGVATQKSDLSQKISAFSTNLGKYEQTVASLLGTKYNMTASEFVVSVMNAIKKTPKLLECDQKSLFASILLSAELKLKPNTPEGFAYIIPYKGQAQFQLGYKGLIEIAYRSANVKGIKGVPVYENEFYEELDNGTFKHIPYTGMDLNIMQLIDARKSFLQRMSMDGTDIEKNIEEYKIRLDKGKGEVVLAYAVCYVEGLEMPIWASVTKDVLAKIQKLSQAGSSEYSPYNSGTDVHNSMQFKAAIKKLFKFLPKQNQQELARAIEVDDKLMAGSMAITNDDGTVEIIDIKYEEVKPNSDIAKSKLDEIRGKKKDEAKEEKKDESPKAEGKLNL